MRLQDKVALVTGAARGIGRAIAERLAQEGADVAVADIRHALLQDTIKAIADLGRQTLALTVDVTQKAQVEQMLQQESMRKPPSSAACPRGSRNSVASVAFPWTVRPIRRTSPTWRRFWPQAIRII